MRAECGGLGSGGAGRGMDHRCLLVRYMGEATWTCVVRCGRSGIKIVRFGRSGRGSHVAGKRVAPVMGAHGEGRENRTRRTGGREVGNGGVKEEEERAIEMKLFVCRYCRSSCNCLVIHRTWAVIATIVRKRRKCLS